MHELLRYLGHNGVTTLLILGQHGLVGEVNSDVDLSYLSDTIILMRFFEAAGAVRRGLSVVKTRTSEHEPIASRPRGARMRTRCSIALSTPGDLSRPGAARLLGGDGFVVALGLIALFSMFRRRPVSQERLTWRPSLTTQNLRLAKRTYLGGANPYVRVRCATACNTFSAAAIATALNPMVEDKMAMNSGISAFSSNAPRRRSNRSRRGWRKLKDRSAPFDR